MSESLRPHGLYSPWNSPGQNTGVGSRSLIQEIFPTQESSQGLLHCRWILYQLSYQGSPLYSTWMVKAGLTKKALSEQKRGQRKKERSRNLTFYEGTAVVKHTISIWQHFFFFFFFFAYGEIVFFISLLPFWIWPLRESKGTNSVSHGEYLSTELTQCHGPCQ